MHNDTISQSVLIVYANYHEYSTMFVATRAPQIWRVFFLDTPYKHRAVTYLTVR